MHDLHHIRLIYAISQIRTRIESTFNQLPSLAFPQYHRVTVALFHSPSVVYRLLADYAFNHQVVGTHCHRRRRRLRLRQTPALWLLR